MKTKKQLHRLKVAKRVHIDRNMIKRMLFISSLKTP